MKPFWLTVPFADETIASMATMAKVYFKRGASVEEVRERIQETCAEFEKDTVCHVLSMFIMDAVLEILTHTGDLVVKGAHADVTRN